MSWWYIFTGKFTELITYFYTTDNRIRHTLRNWSHNATA